MTRRDTNIFTVLTTLPQGFNNLDIIHLNVPPSREVAITVMDAIVNELFVDSRRYALLSDDAGMQQYMQIKNNGECGEYESIVIFNNGVPALVGCNYD